MGCDNYFVAPAEAGAVTLCGSDCASHTAAPAFAGATGTIQ